MDRCAHAFAFIFAMGSLLATQLAQLAGDLPRYQSTISEKIQSFRETTAGRGTLERASGMLKDLSKELDKPKEAASALGAGASPKAAPLKPVPVEVRQPDPGALESLQSLISPLLHPLATTGIIVIFVIFILLQREDLRNRLIRLAGSHDLQRTTAALDDAASRLSRLFLIQLLLNGSFGIVIGTGLWLIGVPSAILWGILAAVLRFVPYIGAVIAAAFPLALAVAVDPTWTMLLWTVALFLVVEPVVGHVIEPMVYGHSTGLFPVAVVASATFWTGLWGPIGLVLATPLTVCLVVLGRHVERLEFLDVMFGDRPALSPPEIFYQRMLAGDPTEASEPEGAVACGDACQPARGRRDGQLGGVHPSFPAHLSSRGNRKFPPPSRTRVRGTILLPRFLMGGRTSLIDDGDGVGANIPQIRNCAPDVTAPGGTH